MADTNPTLSTPSISSINSQKTTSPDAWWLNSTLAAQIADKIKSNSLSGDADDLTSFETKKKVDSMKQKIYVFALAIVAYFIYSYASTAFNTFNANEKALAEVSSKIVSISGEISTFKNNEATLKLIARWWDDVKKNLVNCINNSNLCDKVLTWVKKNLNVTRSYLLLTPLSGSKMEVNQKSLLKYFNEYLLNGKEWSSQLLNITFTNPSLIEQTKKIYEIWIDTTITFPSKAAMMEMIEKVEHGISWDNPLLIKIRSINYDIVKYLEPQTVNVSFIVYQYKK